MGGSLYVQGISDEQFTWESRQLVLFSEQQIELIFQSLAGDRKVKTTDELDQPVRAGTRVTNHQTVETKSISALVRRLTSSNDATTLGVLQ